MKAVRIHEFGPPESLRVDEIDVPEPGPGEALIRVRAVGVNRMDVEQRAGVYGKESLMDFYFGQAMAFPHIPGIEPVGVVEALGEGVSGIAVGDRVAPHSHISCGRCRECLAGHDNACGSIEVLGVSTPGRGGYAEYLAWPAELLMPLPDHVSFESAAGLLVNYAPVWTALIERAEVRPGEVMLVTGATGGCGHAAIQIGRLAGARVLGLGGSDEKLAELEALGAEPIDYRSDVPGQVSRATDGRGADVLLELVGADTWADTIASAAPRARLVVVGSHGGIRAELNLGMLFALNLQVHGATRANRAATAELVRLQGTGQLDPTIWKVLGLEEAAEAHRLMDERRHSGKIVLSV
ncbi:zinc-binding alcohol dehydrogenase family protein [Gordonia sp. NPDC127522]|uniref:quinone oxidoreductase family protein n=1 Tax=Gordonia sp. NPDC127522 TaxID=3345390 RepID=UPI003640FC0E